METGHGDITTTDSPPGVRVLIVSPRPSVHHRLSQLAREFGETVSVARTVLEARRAAAKNLHDMVVIDQRIGDGRGFELAEELGGTLPAATSTIVGDRAELDDALRAMRAGASDLIELALDDEALTERLLVACKRAQRSRAREQRLARLKRLCHQLNSARREVSGHVGELCQDLIEAYRDLSGQLEDVSVTTELASVLRQELDIESLLRTLLEYMLGKIGSMNAAIFLPSTTGEFSLGAYVNYDCPKDTAEVMLDHLANSLAPRFESQTDVLLLSGRAELEASLGEDAHWLESTSTMIVACRKDDECLAVIALFRDRRSPFTESDVKMLRVASEQFGEQLARVIRVHHRHLPKDQWGGFDPDIDEDEGFGDIDMAA